MAKHKSSKHLIQVLVFLSILILGACTNLPDFDDIPKIELVSVSKYGIEEGRDSVIITIRFEDGNGDIGAKDASEKNSYFIDSRFNLPFSFYRIPYVEPAGRVKALSGTIEFKLFQEFFCQPDIGAVDTFQYEIYILDRAGNRSNSIFTETFQIQCQ